LGARPIPSACSVFRSFEIIGDLPKGHAELADQLLRAAQSQPRNIAEGDGRRTTVDQSQFYIHARGSAMEAAAALDTMRVMKLVTEDSHRRAIDLLEGIVGMLTTRYVNVQGGVQVHVNVKVNAAN
jgi:four helix bundle protein